MTAPTITPLPPAPVRNDAPADFASKADAFAAAFPRLVTEANTQANFTDQRAIAADASATAAAVSEAAAGADRAEVAANTAAVAANTATVVARADEVATNTALVASNAAQVTQDAADVASGLAAIAGGPVASVAGQTGVVTLESLRAGGVATQAGAESLTNKAISGPRASMAQFIDKTVTIPAATGAVTLDLSQADVFNLTLFGNTTLAISNAPTLSGETFAIVVRVNQGATARTLTWFSGITWLTPNGTAPAAPAAGKSAEYVFSTTDGTNWIGRTGAAN